MIDDDLSVYLDAEGFGTPAQLAGQLVSGIFIDDYIAADEVATTGPAYLLRTVDAAAVEEDETTLALTHPVSGQAMVYIVRRVQPDGTGLTVLQLRKA